MRLPVSNTYIHISHRFEVIADYCSNLVRKTVTSFFEPLFGGLGATYTVHLRLTVKLVVDFLFVLISLGVTAQVLRANIDWKSPFLQGVGHFGRTFQVEVDVLH